MKKNTKKQKALINVETTTNAEKVDEVAWSATPEIGMHADKTNGIVTTADESDESNEEYGGILSLNWPVDHKTICGLCDTSFLTIGPNGSHYEDIYCPKGCPEERLQEMDKLETQNEKERDQDNRSQYNISDKSKDIAIIAISSKDRVTNTKECELLPNDSADGDTKTSYDPVDVPVLKSKTPAENS